MQFALQSTQDGITIFDIDVNSWKNPYYFNLTKVPRFLPKVQDSIQLVVDCEPYQHLRVAGNLPNFDSFTIQRSNNSDRMEYEVNLNNGWDLFNLTVAVATEEHPLDEDEVLLAEGRLTLLNGLTLGVALGDGGVVSNTMQARIEYGDQNQLDVVAEWDLQDTEPDNWTYDLGLEGLLMGKTVSVIYSTRNTTGPMTLV